MSNESVHAADLALDALGDPSRRRILELVAREPLPVGAIADAMPIGRPAVSKHLRVLQEAGLVQHRSSGTRNLYSLAPEGLTEVQQWLVRTWDVVLAEFARYAQEQAGPPTRSSDDP
jgi:DNA-binding transcriptional ArsR family regulator